MSDKTLARVTLTWDDGTSQTLEGADAAKWLRDVNAPILFQQARNPQWGGLPAHPWKHSKAAT